MTQNHMFKDHFIDLSAGIVGFFAIMLVKIPALMNHADVHRFIVGITFTGVYTVFAWVIRQKLDQWKKNKSKNKKG